MSGNFTISLEDVKLDPTVQILTIIELVYGIPSFMLLICFQFLLGISKVYANSFYRLVQLALLTNTFVYLNTWIAVRMEMHPSCIFFLKFVEELIPGFLAWTKYFTWWFLHIQFLSAASLTVHRISSFWWPQSCEKFWSKSYIFCGLAFALYSFLPTTIWFGFTNEVHILNDTLMRTRNPELVKTATNTTAIFTIIYFIIICVLGIKTSVIINKNKQALSAMYEKIAKKLTHIAIVHCVVFAGILLWSVLTSLNSFWNFFPDFIIGINQTLMVFSSDLMTFSLPPVLLFFDSNVQRQFLPKCCQRNYYLAPVFAISNQLLLLRRRKMCSAP
ncbi:Serpentine receptor class gamma [Caenorhabditis elegans]|uniref:Serpentine receptor class gamma n=1 Tax=Caenorhabditis elegans TaxID=6239 RepID=Q86B41_CAEEL|nr:Serpentine receptor class gamma [Caenorhabditis elegans]CCD65539.1 Serpentine receptor class gamma [Caenorhabditis elegans]|eukprot:NP_504449.2 Serpentine receptor class gamma [Caenorhabditis elegans]